MNKYRNHWVLCFSKKEIVINVNAWRFTPINENIDDGTTRMSNLTTSGGNESEQSAAGRKRRASNWGKSVRSPNVLSRSCTTLTTSVLQMWWVVCRRGDETYVASERSYNDFFLPHDKKLWSTSSDPLFLPLRTLKASLLLLHFTLHSDRSEVTSSREGNWKHPWRISLMLVREIS